MSDKQDRKSRLTSKPGEFTSSPVGAGELDPALSEVEQALACLRPVPAAVPRDEMMFAAGKAAVAAELQLSEAAAVHLDRTRWLWPAATVLSTAASILLAVLLAQSRADLRQLAARTGGEPSQPPVAVAPALPNEIPQQEPLPAEPPPAPAVTYDFASRRLQLPLPGVAAEDNYLVLRDLALTRGVDALSAIAYRQARPPVSRGSDVSAFSPRPTPTARELLEELLPPTERPRPAESDAQEHNDAAGARSPQQEDYA